MQDSGLFGRAHRSVLSTFSRCAPDVQNRLQSTIWIMHLSSRALLRCVSLHDWEMNHSFPWLLGAITHLQQKNKTVVGSADTSEIMMIIIFLFGKKNPVKIHWHDNLQEALLKAERYTNDSRVCSTLKTRDWDGLIHRLWEDKRTEKQADYSEIRIFAWKYKMGHGLGSVYNWGQRWRLTWVSRWQQLSITGAVE